MSNAGSILKATPGKAPEWSKLTVGQEIVLGQHFSGHREDVTFEQVMQDLISGDEDTDVWEPFCEWDENFFIQHCRDLARAIDKTILEATHNQHQFCE